MLLLMYPESSCLVQEILKYLPERVKAITFDNLEELKENYNNCLENQKETFILNFSNPKKNNEFLYNQNMTELLDWHDALPNKEKSFIVMASSVGVKPRYIDLGNKEQLQYNIDRSNAERTFYKSDSWGVILRIPLVACKENSLLKRFKKETQKIQNPSKKIPVLPPNKFAKVTIRILESFKFAKDLQMNIIPIDYKSEEYTIEELYNNLRNGNMFDYLLK